MINECNFCHKYAGDNANICLSCRVKLIIIGILVILFVVFLANTSVG